MFTLNVDECTREVKSSVTAGATARPPALDITPHRYIPAIITERGVARDPYAESLRGMFH